MYYQKEFKQYLQSLPDNKKFKQFLVILIEKCQVEPYNIVKNEVGIKWTIGGMSGGSCWGDNADSSVDAEPEPELKILDNILEIFYPDISYLKYKKILSECVAFTTDCNNEYYGNYTNYGCKYINLQSLFNILENDNKLSF